MSRAEGARAMERVGKWIAVAAVAVALGWAYDSEAGVDRWTSRGPYGGRVFSTAIDATNPANVFGLALSGSGLFRSTDRGCTWDDMNVVAGRPDDFGLYKVSAAPASATFFLGTTYGVYRSTDLGVSWNALGSATLNTSVGAVAVAPSNANRIYAANPISFSGRPPIWISSNGGTTWAAGGTGLTDVPVHELIVHPTNANVVYAWPRNDRDGLFRSTDGGASFTHVGPLLGPGFFYNNLAGADIDRQNPNVLYASNFYGQVWKTTNGGTSWTELFLGISDTHRLIVDPLRSSTVYVQEGATRLFKSTDSGVTWESFSTRPPFRGQPFDFEINPRNPSEMYSGNNAGATYKSTNGGRTWSDARLGIDSSQPAEIVLAPTDRRVVFVPTVGDGLQKSTDGGDTWRTLPTTSDYIEHVAVDPTNALNLIYANFFGGIFRSTDGGDSSTFVEACIGGVGKLVYDASNPTIAYARCWQQGVDLDGDGVEEGILKSTDSGQTWQSMNVGLPVPPAQDGQWRSLAISASNPLVLYTGRGNTPSLDTIWRSTDGGATWVDVGNVPGFLMDLEVDPVDPMTVWGASGFGGGQGVFRSTDGGVTFQARNNGIVPVPPTPAGSLTVQDIAINPNDRNELVIGVAGSGVWRSTDAGANWSQLDGTSLALRRNSVDAVALDPAQPRNFFAGGVETAVRKLTLVDPANPAGVTVTPTAGLFTTEEGSIDRFEVVLDRAPTANVTISLTSSDLSEGTVAPASLTFTPGNWFMPQVVTVTGVDDGPMGLVDGPQTYMIVTGNAVSGDGAYSGMVVDDVTVVNLDKDIPGVIIVPTAGLVTTEAGGTDSFTVVLNSQIDAGSTVTIAFTSSDTTEGTVPASVTFNDTNELTPQTVVVTGQPDGILDGDQPYTILTAPAVSSDPDYSGLDPLDVAAVNLDSGVGPRLTATKRDALQVDLGTAGVANPNDQLRYTVTLTNTGNAAASTVRFVSDDFASSAGLALVVGSVSAPGGTIVRGNTAGNTVVEVTYASLAASASVTFTFDALVLRPFPVGQTEVSCQGTVSSTVVPAFRTDDPDTAPLADPTLTPVVANATLTATKTPTQTLDLDADGRLDPGDRLRYDVVVTNTGDRNATEIYYDDLAPVGTRLVCASPAPTIFAGSATIVSCASGDTGRLLVSIPVLQGTPGPTGSVTIRFTVEVLTLDAAARLASSNRTGGTLPTQVCNTGLVTGYGGGGFTPVSTNGGTPACTALDAADVSATKTYALINDQNADGDADAGDRLRYTVALAVAGNGGARAVTFHDELGAFARFDCATLSVTPAATTQTCVNGTGVPPSYGGLDLSFASLPAGPVTITLEAIVNSSLPDFVSDTHPICNWGAASGQSFLRDLSGTATTNDNRTCVPIVANPVIVATKSDALVVDVDGDTQADAGDRLRYSLVIQNVGDRDGNGVTLSVPAGADATLVVGSVVTSQGTVTTGNGAGDTTVVVDVGTVAALTGTVSITFDVVIDKPLAAGVTEVACQGTVAGVNFISVLTDDPDTMALGDPTVTSVFAAPAISATKVDAITVDGDADGNADPGDTLRYTVVVANTGDRDAAGVVFTSAAPLGTSLVVGSVTTSGGTVTTGNTAGDTSVAVNVGTVAGVSGSVTITFDVLVTDPAVVDRTTISCQGLVSGTNFSNVSTDDPSVAGGPDPTETPLTATAIVSATKADAIVIDGDGDGNADPGDRLRYTVIVRNDGDRDVALARFATGIDPASTLVVGSVTTSAGAVSVGNTAGDGAVEVLIGALGGDGGSVTITFDVDVVSPLPAGVTQLSCQGTVDFDSDGTGGRDASLVTDDPATATGGDPTVTPLTAAAVVAATKTDALVVDVDGDSNVDPGDTIEYTVVIANSGDRDASMAAFASGVDAATALVVGSVTTTAGTVVTGNGGGDTSVSVAIGTLAGGGGTATITLRVLVDRPFPAGLASVSCQGAVSGGNFAATMTDDPATGTPLDATTTPITAAASLTATKAASLAIDVDGDTNADPGDRLRYAVVITNAGDQDAAAVAFASGVDVNSALVVGSVGATLGAVTTGNTAGDTSVAVAVGTLPGVGGTSSLTITFDVVVDSPLAAGVASVSCQGTVTATGLGPLPTDDPSTGAAGDPTVTAIDAAPDLVVTKDDGGAIAIAGTTVIYQVTYRNAGNQDATGVALNETVPVDSTFVAGSSDAGWMCAATTAGSACTLPIANLMAGAAPVTVAFAVRIDDPLPVGVSSITNTVTITDDDTNGADLDPASDTDTEITSTDDDPPAVAGVDTVPSTSGGLAECEELRQTPTALRVTFDEAMADPVGNAAANDVTNPAVYRLVAAGVDRVFQTAVCGGPSGDDVAIPIAGVSWDGGSATATLTLGVAPKSAQHRLLVCDAVTDTGGNALDGDGDGSEGGDFVRTFRLERVSRFEGSYFDCDTAPWIEIEGLATEVGHDALTDVSGADTSGSALAATASPGSSLGVAQCVTVFPRAAFDFSAAAQVDVTGSLFLARDCEAFSSPACAGTSLGRLIEALAQTSTGGGWARFSSPFTFPLGAVSALCAVTATPPAGEHAIVRFDDVRFVDRVLFADGFETGDTSRWSSAVGN